MIVKVLVNDLINKFIWSKVFNHINQNEVWEKGKFWPIYNIQIYKIFRRYIVFCMKLLQFVIHIPA